MVKKSYNPFKMWGSYVGAGIFYLLYINILKVLSGGIGFGTGMNYSWYETIIITLGFTTKRILDLYSMPFFSGYQLFLTLTMIIVGFLIGWGIHSLIRRLRK